MSRRAATPLAVLALGLTLAGCQKEQHEAAPAYHPSSVGEVTSAGVKPVTFTTDGAAQVDLALDVVRRAGSETVIPYASLIYDGKGVSWVYTNPNGTTYIRVKVAVDRVIGNDVFLRSGPPVGTRVVTVGSTQVYGAELGIEGGH